MGRRNNHAWEQRKLGEVFEQTSNFVNPNEHDIELWSLTVEDGLTPKSERYSREFLVKKEGNFKEVRPGDIVYNPMNITLGAVGFNSMSKSVAVSGYYTTMIAKEENDAYYINTWLKSPKALFLYKTYATGSLIEKQRVQFPTLSIIPALFPSFAEQQKIGEYFSNLDNLITLHQRKCEQTKELKKFMLQKMFPKKGEKNPEIRFPGFTDDWELRKLNEVSDIYDGTHQTPKYQDDGVMFLSVENIKTLTSNKFISREAFEDEFKIRPQRGDVLMTRIGDIGTANVVETDEDLAYYVSLALFKSEELNPYFLQASIYAPFVQDQIWKRTLHIAFPKKINKNEIGQVPINVPTLAEQTKIGSFFKQLDNTITLHQRKCEQLKELKKFMLQNMFPKKG